MLFRKLLLILTSLIFSVQFIQIYTIESKSLASEAKITVAKISLEAREKMFDAIVDRNLDAIWQLNALGVTVDPRAYYRTKPLHKAIDSRDLKVIKTILGLSKPLAHYQTECLLDAYAYAQQRYDFIKLRPTGPMLDTKGRPFYQENFVYQADLKICQFLERRVRDAGITADYNTVTVYIPECDDAKYGRLRPKLYCQAGADQHLIPKLLHDNLDLDHEYGETRAKLESWDGLKVYNFTVKDSVVKTKCTKPTELICGDAIDIGQAKLGLVPELAKFDSVDVTVGAAMLHMQALRPQRVGYPYEAPMQSSVVESPVCTQGVEELFDDLEQARADSTSINYLHRHLCGSVTVLTVAVLAMAYNYYGYFE